MFPKIFYKISYHNNKAISHQSPSARASKDVNFPKIRGFIWTYRGVCHLTILHYYTILLTNIRWYTSISKPGEADIVILYCDFILGFCSFDFILQNTHPPPPPTSISSCVSCLLRIVSVHSFPYSLYQEGETPYHWISPRKIKLIWYIN